MTKLIKSTAFRRIVGLILALVLVVGLYPYLQPSQEASGTTNETVSSETVEGQEVDDQLSNEDNNTGNEDSEENLEGTDTDNGAMKARIAPDPESEEGLDDSTGDEGLDENPDGIAEEIAAGTGAEDVVIEAPTVPDSEDEGVLDDSVVDEGIVTVAGKIEKAGEEEPVDPTIIEGNGPRENVYGEIKADTTVVGDITYTSGEGTLTINGTLVGNIYIEGNSAPVISVSKEGRFDGNLVLRGGGATATLTVDGHMNGNIKVTGGSTLIVDGADTGIIKGAKDGGSVIDVQGSKAIIRGALKITGGTGSELANPGGWVDQKPKYGGALLVQRNENQTPSRVEVLGGKLIENTANFGGGIYVDEACTLVMTGGSVFDNKVNDEVTQGEVSGIYFNEVSNETSVTIASGERLAGSIRFAGCDNAALKVDGSAEGDIQVWDSAPSISVGSNGTLTSNIGIQGSQKTTLVVDGKMAGNVEANEASGNLDMTINGNLEGNVSLDSGNGSIVIKGTMVGNLTTACSVLKLTADGYLNGKIKETKASDLTIYGNGTIGSKDSQVDGSVINVIASKLSIEGNATIQGGTGSKFEYAEKDKKTNSAYGGAEYQGSGWYFHLVNDNIDQSMTFGGGILVQRDGDDGTKGSALYMKNGTVKGNSASAGGGILIDQFCDFTMDNGVIDGNVATNAEGGGIYLLKEGIATINAGSVINNKTQTVRDWGGGGIFVQSQRTLTFGGAATITDNTADGLGGGLSGCPHAAMGVGEITNGFAIYGNHANGEAPEFETNNSFLWYNAGVGDQLFFKENSNGTYGYNSYTYSAFKPAGSSADRLDVKFRTENSQDYYCVKNTNVFGQQLGESDDNAAFKGVAFTSTGNAYISTDKDATTGRTIISNKPTKGAVTFDLKNGEWLKATNVSIGLTAMEQPNQSADRPILIRGNSSTTHGGGIGCNGGLVMGSLPDVVTESPAWSIEFEKQILGPSGKPLADQNMEAGQFTFELYDEARDAVVATASNGEGNDVSKVKFNVSDPYYAGSADGEVYNFIIREVNPGDYTSQEPAKVEVKVEKVTVRYSNTADTVFQGRTVVKSQVADDYPRFDGSQSKNELVFANSMDPITTTWAPTATKYFFGNGTREFAFNMYELADPGDESSIASLIADVDPVEGTASVASGGSAAITIPDQTITSEGTHWYALTEAGDDPQDPTIYIYGVVVGLNGDDTAFEVSSNLYYVHSIDDQFDSKVFLGDGAQTAEFSNYDENYSLRLAGYAVNFYTNAPIGKQCLVDPKIFKKLEGRALQAGEFTFKLIEVNNYRDLVPTGFSVTATNDEYGMVDFDKAGVIGYDEDGNPCCLSFTAPGTYTYIVEEAPGYQHDPSITYDETTYTFTAVVEDVDGVLKNTAMYYGELGEDGQNTEIEGSREDPSFHPTLINEARPMDLRVRKTSAEGRDEQTGLGTDTGEGLNGAVYGLYMVNEGGSHNDIFLGQATSEPTMVLVDGEYIEQDGWNTFRDVNLTEDNLYYFKEISAPDEHTVDPFRSMYFKIAVDRDSDGNPLSYGLAYTDARSTADGVELYAQGDDARVTPATDEGDRMVFTYDNGSGLGSGGVFDQVTSIGFSKRDTHTQDWVSGAKLQLLTEDETVVAEWVTRDSVYQIDKTLNVNQKYILRELEAPAGYDRAADVVFHMDDYGNLVLDSGQSKGQLRNCEVNGTQLTVYDLMIDAELVGQETREHVTPVTWTDNLPKMGDSILVGLFIGIAGASVVGFVSHRVRRRANED